jgi:hypothetical protein
MDNLPTGKSDFLKAQDLRVELDGVVLVVYLDTLSLILVVRRNPFAG